MFTTLGDYLNKWQVNKYQQGTRCRDEEIGVVVLADRPAGQKASSSLLAARPLAQALSQVVGKEGSQERRADQRTGLSD